MPGATDRQLPVAMRPGGYEMIPPHQVHVMTAIRGLLDRENAGAKREDRTWTA